MPRQHVLEPPAGWAWWWPSQSSVRAIIMPNRLEAQEHVAEASTMSQVNKSATFSLSFSATWLSPSSHRVTAKSYTDLRRMELERGKKCADVQMLVPSHARKTQLISQAARTCENTDFTTWFPDCGQTLPWGGARPVSIRHFFFVKPSFLLYDGNWHCLTWSMAPLCSIFAAVGSFEALPGVSSGPLWVLRDSEPPGVARNAAKTLGSLKSLTLKFKALVLHNLDWAESASKVICNHWDYLYLFVSICGNRFVFFDRDALRPSRRLRLTPGRTCWLRRARTQARRTEVLPDAGFRFLPGLSAQLWDSHLPTFAYSLFFSFKC